MLGTSQRQRVLQELLGHLLRVVAVFEQVEAHATGGDARGRLDGFGNAAKRVLTHHHAVDNHLDGVLELLVKLDFVTAQIADLAVDAHAAEALV